MQLYKGKNTTVDDLNAMEITQSAIKETLRYSGPVPRSIMRVSLRDHYLGKVHVKKGTIVQINSCVLGFNPNNFDNADVFDPSRWTRKLLPQSDPYAYLPFFAGPHNCIGQHLSQIETKIILSEFLLRYKSKISEGYVHRMNDRALYEPDMDFIMDVEKVQ